MSDAEKSEPHCGFIFATTGKDYTTLARRAARNLKLVHPDAVIDIFTDQNIDDAVFDRIHPLSESWFRPKIEAIAKSRFERTICLDADAVVVGDLMPVFELLDQFDIAACLDRNLNSRDGRLVYTDDLPVAYAQINTGVLAIRKNDTTQELLKTWMQEMKTSGNKLDQPVFRQVLYTSDARICTLPPGYNLLTFNELKSWWGYYGAPRVLHSNFLHRRRGGPGNAETPFQLYELVGLRNARRVRGLIHADYHLTPDASHASRRMNSPLEPGGVRWLRRQIAPLYHWVLERKRR
ncbi:MAG: putative nucleotide-diphospho-sugar transferase [Pseudomonadota bacterium]